MKNISKKRITLGTKQFVPMFEQFLNESMEEEEQDEDMEIEEGGGDEDVEMESEEGGDMGDSGEEGSDEDEKEEIEERIQEAYRRGLAKGKKYGAINESETLFFDTTTKISELPDGNKLGGFKQVIDTFIDGKPCLKTAEVTNLNVFRGIFNNGVVINCSLQANTSGTNADTIGKSFGNLKIELSKGSTSLTTTMNAIFATNVFKEGKGPDFEQLKLDLTNAANVGKINLGKRFPFTLNS
jgi:hypothetical protein